MDEGGLEAPQAADVTEPDLAWRGACAGWRTAVTISKQAADSYLPPGFESEGARTAQWVFLVDDCTSFLRGTALLLENQFQVISYILLANSTPSLRQGYLVDWVTDADELIRDGKRHGLPIRAGGLSEISFELGGELRARSSGWNLQLNQSSPVANDEPVGRDVVLFHDTTRMTYRFDVGGYRAISTVVVSIEGGPGRGLLPLGKSASTLAQEVGSMEIKVN